MIMTIYYAGLSDLPTVNYPIESLYLLHIEIAGYLKKIYMTVMEINNVMYHAIVKFSVHSV